MAAAAAGTLNRGPLKFSRAGLRIIFKRARVIVPLGIQIYILIIKGGFMKQLFVLLAAFASLNVFADSKIKTAVAVNCNLSDLSKQDDPNIKTERLELTTEDTVKWISYNGHKYEIAYFDVSYGGPTRYELSIDARDEKTGAVIGSANATYATEMPSLNFQDGGNVLLDCTESTK
jgi:hypothetical protein